MNNKKGQAAMEFLMTYGWAILAAVIAIGVLAYFGVFSPGKSMPDLCTLNAPLGCDEFQVTASDVSVVIRNGAGSPINVNVTAGSDCTNVSNVLIADGSTETIVLGGSSCTPTGKFNEDLVVTYLRQGAQFSQTSTGRITAEVVA